MKTLKLETKISAVNYWPLLKIMAVLLLCIAAQLAPVWLQNEHFTMGMLDQSIWLLWFFAMFSYLTLGLGCWFILQWLWAKLGLPSIQTLSAQFRQLSLWQQLIGYWASFALLLLGSLLSLVAVF